MGMMLAHCPVGADAVDELEVETVQELMQGRRTWGRFLLRFSERSDVLIEALRLHI